MKKFNRSLLKTPSGELEVWLEKCYPKYGKIVTQALEDQKKYLEYFKDHCHGSCMHPGGFEIFKINIAKDFDYYPSALGTNLMEFYRNEKV